MTSARMRPSRANPCRISSYPTRGAAVSLDALLQSGPVAVTFHRGHWCPYCRINTRALAEAQDKIAAEGGQVTAIMPDREHFTSELKAESHAPFPILTDFDNGYALSLNLAFYVGEEMQKMMTGAGWDVFLLARQRHLAFAGTRDIRRGHRWQGQGALRRSGLSQAHDYRDVSVSAQNCALAVRSGRGGVGRPVVGPQHLQHSRGNGRALSPGDSEVRRRVR